MSATEIIAELQKLTHEERREVARQLFALEEDAQILADSDRRANENFLLLDAMEAKDAGNKQSR